MELARADVAVRVASRTSASAIATRAAHLIWHKRRRRATVSIRRSHVVPWRYKGRLASQAANRRWLNGTAAILHAGIAVRINRRWCARSIEVAEAGLHMRRVETTAHVRVATAATAHHALLVWHLLHANRRASLTLDAVHWGRAAIVRAKGRWLYSCVPSRAVVATRHTVARVKARWVGRSVKVRTSTAVVEGGLVRVRRRPLLLLLL